MGDPIGTEAIERAGRARLLEWARELARDETLTEEHARAPFGPHGPRLEALLTVLRAGPLEGRTVIRRIAADDWRPARLRGRDGSEPRRVETSDRGLPTRAAAEHTVFVERVAELRAGRDVL